MFFAARRIPLERAVEYDAEDELFKPISALRRLQRDGLIIRIVLVDEFARHIGVRDTRTGLVSRRR